MSSEGSFIPSPEQTPQEELRPIEAPVAAQ